MGCFAADPDASMDDVAQAAGVVRRTVYAHFPNREALVDGIAEEAAAALAAAVDRPDPEEPDLALAAAALMTWPVGDRFRVLLSFARKEVGDERIGELIAPLRARTLAIVERGCRSGVFSAYLPAVVLVGMLEGSPWRPSSRPISGWCTTRGRPSPWPPSSSWGSRRSGPSTSSSGPSERSGIGARRTARAAMRWGAGTPGARLASSRRPSCARRTESRPYRPRE
jgi:AcrR family transcriptional regulator